MSESADRWPARLRERCENLRTLPPGPERERAREEVWILLGSAMLERVRRYAARAGGVDREDLEDVAAQKTLQLVTSLESGERSVEGRGDAELVGFISRVARNGVVDFLRRAGRQVHIPDAEEIEASAEPRMESEPTDVRTERNEFVEALRDCASRLRPAALRIWFFRVFYELPTRDISEHPEVRLSPGNVDMILKRSRDSVRECMERRGLVPGDMPVGAFASLWRAFRVE